MATNREIWRSVNGYANYEVSCFGRVRNATTERILKPQNNGHGYLRVGLNKEGKKRLHLVHQLVASEFLDNPLNLKYADHIDNDRSNNNLDNLRFCSSSQNSMNRTKRGSVSSIYKGVSFHKRKNKWIVQITINGILKHLGYFNDEKEAARVYNEKAREYFGDFSKLNIIED